MKKDCIPKHENKLYSQIGPKKKLITRTVFKREIEFCKNLFRENNGKCSWGKCENCGVIPLLYKLHKGRLLEGLQEIKKIKEKILFGKTH